MHRSRDELVEALQRAKIERDMEQKREQDSQDHEPMPTAANLSHESRMQARRASLDRLNSQVESMYNGDLFGTHGPYSEGLLYLMRRRTHAAKGNNTAAEAATAAAAAKKKRQHMLQRSTASVSEDNDIGVWLQGEEKSDESCRNTFAVPSPFLR
jgi:hypothetical protein